MLWTHSQSLNMIQTEDFPNQTKCSGRLRPVYRFPADEPALPLQLRHRRVLDLDRFSSLLTRRPETSK